VDGLNIVDQSRDLRPGLRFLLGLLWRWLVAAGQTGCGVGQGFVVRGAVRIGGSGAILGALANLLTGDKGKITGLLVYRVANPIVCSPEVTSSRHQSHIMYTQCGTPCRNY